MASSAEKYVRATLRLEAARNSDYTGPIFDESVIEETTPTAPIVIPGILATTGGLTLDLGMYATSIANIIVHCRDSTNYVDGTFRTTANGSNDNILRAVAGGFFATGGPVTVANDLVLTANGASCEVDVYIFGEA